MRGLASIGVRARWFAFRTADGRSVGSPVGSALGSIVGTDVGVSDGLRVGDREGLRLGSSVGPRVLAGAVASHATLSPHVLGQEAG